jgi:hypothetical protein
MNHLGEMIRDELSKEKQIYDAQPLKRVLRSRVCYSFEGFVYIDKENRTNLEAKSKKCTFIGYNVNDFGYRLWDYENHKIIRSRDVVFNQKVKYKDWL